MEYISDFMNNPDIVNHPGFKVLTRQGQEFQNSIERQGFLASQGSVRLLIIKCLDFVRPCNNEMKFIWVKKSN